MRPMLTMMLLAASCAGGPVDAADWRMVPQASRLRFIARYEGSDAPGVFRQFEAVLHFDPAAPGSGRIEVGVETAGADMDSAEINEAIAGPDWLDSKRHPRAQFLSSRIAPDGLHGYVATGMLKLKGRQREMSVPFTWEQHGGRARLHGTAELDRTEFGIGSGDWAADEPIARRVRVELTLDLLSQ